MYNSVKLSIPSTNNTLYPGNIVKLGRFDAVSWVVCFGWYSWGGNRPVCGWFLRDKNQPDTIKPLQLPDLDDIYIITT